MSLPAFTLKCECPECANHRATLAVQLQHYPESTWAYAQGLDSINADEELCSGGCETHGSCADAGLTCGECDECDALCTCEKCKYCDSLLDTCECCSECGSSYCSGPCGDCGCCECECDSCSCGDCGGSGEGDSFGTSSVAPWVARGYDRSSGTAFGSWFETWSVDLSTDLCQSAADYYLLEALAGGVVNHGAPDDRYLSMLRSEATASLGTLVASLDRTFTGYVDAIIGGELRHHQASGSLRSNSRTDAWVEWKAIRDHSGVEALRDAETLFLEFSGSSYGGVAWANITKVLIARLTGQITPATFIDRVWNLQHNGGSLFDKGSWSDRNRLGWGYQQLNQWILPAHGALRTPWSVLLSVASDEVRDLFCEYWRAANRAKAGLGLARLAMPALSLPTMRVESYYSPGSYSTQVDSQKLQSMMSAAIG